MPGHVYAKLLTGLTVNLLVRDVLASLPFYTEVLGLNCPYSDPDFACDPSMDEWTIPFGFAIRLRRGNSPADLRS